MKAVIANLLLPLLVNGAAVTIEPRQADLLGSLSGLIGSLGQSMMGRVAPKQKAVKIEELKPRNPAAKRIRMTWGPLKVRGSNVCKAGNRMSMDPDGTGWNIMADTDFPTDVILTDAIVEIQSDKYKRVTLEDNIYTHHFLVFDMAKPQKPSFTCDNGQKIKYVPVPGTVIMGGAAEDAEAHYSTPTSRKTGYHVKKNSPIMMNIDVVNYNKDDMNVYASADMEYIPKRTEEYLDASPVFVPVAACDKGLVVPGIVSTPKGQTKWTMKSTGIIAAEDAILFLFRGHVHDGGNNVEVKVNGKVVCDSIALYGGGPGHTGKTADGKSWETIRDMKTCPDGVTVKKGDKIDITANFDVVAHPARPSGGHSHGGDSVVPSGMLGSLGGMMGEGAEQMAVSIIYSAPLVSKP